MAKSVVFFMFLFLILRQTTASDLSDSEGEVSDVVPVSDAALRHELDHLKSKISLAESSLDERAQELKSKEKAVEELNRTIEEKSKFLESLQREVLSLKEKLSSDAKKQEGEAHGRAIEIQEQINSLKKEIEAQNKKKDVLEARASKAEQRIQDLSLKLENLHRTNDEQKLRIRKTQRALEVAEEELMKAKREAACISKQLTEVKDAWLPPWFLVHYAYCKSYVVTKWDKHGRPRLDLAVKKALETKSELSKWAEPHVDTLKSEWIPIMKEHCIVLASDFSQHLKTFTAKAINISHASKVAIEPHVLRLQEALDPHYQEAKKFAKPYVYLVSSGMKPHVEKARLFLKPYMKKVIRSYRKFMKHVAVYRQRVQTTLLELLKSHKLTKPLATKEITFYMASALMVIPLIFVLNLTFSIFSKKPERRARSSHSTHTRRKNKRLHPERPLRPESSHDHTHTSER